MPLVNITNSRFILFTIQGGKHIPIIIINYNEFDDIKSEAIEYYDETVRVNSNGNMLNILWRDIGLNFDLSTAKLVYGEDKITYGRFNNPDYVQDDQMQNLADALDALTQDHEEFKQAVMGAAITDPVQQ